MQTMFYTCTFSHVRADLWEGRKGVPVMIVASNFLTASGKLRIRAVPEQCRPLFADCGGFYFALKRHDYPFTYDEYVAWLIAMKPNYAATWDYPCEAELASDDIAVLSRQGGTLDHARALLAYDVPWTWVPVLQGRTVEQYVRHARMYTDAGLVQPYMGIGSLCRRTHVAEITAIISTLHEALPDTRFHLFGVKAQIFRQDKALPRCVESADSGAWNGMFGDGRYQWKAAQARGMKQVQYEVWDALPAYQAKIEAALSGPKQMGLFS